MSIVNKSLNKKTIVVAITGASGAIYAHLLLNKLVELKDQLHEVSIVFSKTASEIWDLELVHCKITEIPFKVYDNDNFYAPFASGSSTYDTMLVLPCTMGTLGRIAHGTAEDLISRAADVMLKERKKLILVPRETPYSLIHIENMRTITLAGGIICPANPSFYLKPTTIEQLAETVVNRVLKLTGFEFECDSWMESD